LPRRLRKQIKRRRFVTLLEVLIAMGLVSILLTVLLGIYGQTVRAQYEIERRLQDNFQLLYAQFRFNQIMPNILNPAKDRENYGIAFYQEGTNSLVFGYDNGTGAGPNFSNEVIGRLFVDDQNRLLLLTWPVPKRAPDIDPPMRTEVLLENVDKIGFEFYKPVPPAKKRLEIDPETKTGDAGMMLEAWSPDEEDIPAILKIHVTLLGGEQIDYAFVLSNTQIPVSYL